MFAVFETGSKQYHVKSGDVVKIEKVSGAVGDTVDFDQVIIAGDKIGAPLVKGAAVKAEILEQTKTDKVIVFKKKRRHNYRRKKGHRQEITVLRVKEIKA